MDEDTPMEDVDAGNVVESMETDNAPEDAAEGLVTDEQWHAMRDVLEAVLNYRDENGYDPTKLFHKRVNKRFIPSYYEIIKEPMAFSVIKTAVSNRTYNTFEGFVRDCALIWHNAHTYNRPGVAAYEDASTVKTALELQFQKLVDEKIISEEQKAWPDLGEIPEADPIPSEPENEEEEEGDEKEDDDEDEDESEDTEEEGGRKKRKRGRRPSGVRRDTGGEKTLKKRGRPPKVDTPMEARIKNVLKGIRKHKNAQGDLMIHNFEKLPDKGTLPEYYADIKEPIAIEIIKRKQKRKKYNSVEHFMKDIDLMFDNAMSYNMDDSVIYKDAAFLKKEAHKLADIEMKRPDKDFVMEDGRVPLPKGITYNGELWQVGDWVHLRNANDVTKPIIAQIYRTWQNQEGEHWINACWYYRPEQTIHHYERHFLPNEVVKTGQYRDHPIKDIVDRCFVMFITRYHKGRPRGIPMEREIYVCKARYNEEKHKMNEIKTWTSCLPDEVREKDYEMDLFGDQRKIKEVPSPLLHMLKDDQKDDEMPSPQWGAPGAPPIVGGVYKGERDKDQAPPPEPTPSPPPPPPAPLPKQPSQREQSDYRKSEFDRTMEEATRAFGAAPNDGRRPLPSPQIPRPQQSQSGAASHVQQSTQLPGTPHLQHSSSSYDNYTLQSTARSSYPVGRASQVAIAATMGSRGTAPSEVWVLPDTANVLIPPETRAMYQCDEQGRVLFWTQPPVDTLPPAPELRALSHTVKYRLAKMKRDLQAKIEAEKNAIDTPQVHISPSALLSQPPTRTPDSEKAMQDWIGRTQEDTRAFYQQKFPSNWAEIQAADERHTAARQVEEAERQAEEARRMAEEHARLQEAEKNLYKAPREGYLDDVDPMFAGIRRTGLAPFW